MALLLLTLPTEVLGLVFENLVMIMGLKRAVKLRVTCRTFDSGIRLATWTTRALEVQDGLGTCGEYAMADYLLMRTRADSVSREHSMTTTIFETIACLQHIDGSQVRHNVDHLQEACLAIARHNGDRTLLSGRLYSKPQQVLSRSWGLSRTFSNVLALAVHLGLVPIVEILIEEGIPDTETPFGFPIVCAAVHVNPEVARAYLKAKSKRRELSSLSLTSIEPVKAWNPAMGYTITKHPRDISGRCYHKAISEAACCGTLEVVKLFVNAAIEDDRLDPYRPWPVVWPRQRGQSSVTVRKYTTILLLALRHNQPEEFVRFALDNGADPDGYIDNIYNPSITALEFAARKGSKSLFNLLLAKGADIFYFHSHRKQMVYPLVDNAVSGGCLEIIKTYLEAKVPIPSTNFLLAKAINKRRPDILQLLIEHGVTVEPGSRPDRRVTHMLDKVQDDKMTAMIESMRRREQISRQTPA